MTSTPMAALTSAGDQLAAAAAAVTDTHTATAQAHYEATAAQAPASPPAETGGAPSEPATGR